MPEPQAYSLSLGTDVERFRPEIEYVFHILDLWYGLRRSNDATRHVHYGSNPPAGAAAIPAVIFPLSITVMPDGLRLDRAHLPDLESNTLPFLPVSPAIQQNRLSYDAVGLMFFMLSRIEERDASHKDHYERCSATETLAFRRGLMATPLADLAARDIVALIAAGRHVAVRTAYTVHLTHDVDGLKGYHQLLHPLRYAAGDIFKRRNISGALTRLHGSYLSGEPFRSFRDVMSLSERYGLKSHFYFMGPSHHPMDSPYTASMVPLLRQVANEVLQRGHVIGFHPGFATMDDDDEWLRQKHGLEAAIDVKVFEGRQHVLRYRAERTPAVWDAAGMKFDYTLGFPELSGFRAGTCRPFPAYSLIDRRRLALMQGCTAIMDFGLFGGKYRDLSLETALEECRAIVQTCRAHNGTLVVLYHTGQTSDRVRTFYDTLLDFAA